MRLKPKHWVSHEAMIHPKQSNLLMLTKRLPIRKKEINKMEQENKQMDLSNMKTVENTKIDVSKFVGNFVDIEKVESIETQYGTAIKVSSKIVETIEIEGKENIELRATRIFSISKEGEIILDSKLDKFMTKQNVAQPSELVGTKIQVLKNEKDFLTF